MKPLNEITTDDLFPSRFLKVDELPENWRVTGTITDVTLEETFNRDTNEKEWKATLMVSGVEKPMIVNVTNATILENLFGTKRIIEWKGKRITLYRTLVMSFGKRVPAVRVAEQIPPNDETPEVFHSPEIAIAWGLQQGAFESIQHSQNAYERLKRERTPKTAREMTGLWVADVQRRMNEIREEE